MKKHTFVLPVRFTGHFPWRPGIWLLLLQLGTTMLQAQMDDPRFDIRRMGVQNGLENQIITTIVEGADHSLWFGAQNGLYHYDGFRITRIDTQSHNLKLQINSSITAMAIDPAPDGVIFVCTKLNAKMLDPRTGRFIAAVERGIQDSLFSKFNFITPRRDGSFFAVTKNTVYTIDRQKSGQYSCQQKFSIPYSPLFMNIVADLENPDALWLLLPDNVIWHASPEGLEQYVAPRGKNNHPGLKGLIQLVYTSKGIFCWDLLRNIYHFDKRTRQFADCSKTVPLQELIPEIAAVDQAMKQKEGLRCVLKLGINQVALGTTLGLFMVRKKTTGFTIVTQLQEEEIRGIYTDSTGRLGVGTYYGFYTGYFGQNSMKKKPEIVTIWDFLPLDKNKCLVGLEKPAGLAIWDPVADKLVDSVRAHVQNTDKTWLGVLSLERDFLGKIWIGTTEGLYWSTIDAPLMPYPYTDPISGAKFLHSNMRAILATPDSSLWVGANDGVFCFKYSPTFHQYQLKGRESYIGNVQVSDLFPDAAGNIWVATKGKGIARIARKSQQVQWFDTENGLSNNMTCRIESSHHDSVLWISTHNGLSRLAVHSSNFHNYYEDSGFPGNEFNSAASGRQQDGTLLFGGVNGLIYFHPDSIQYNDYHYEATVPYVQIYHNGIDTLIGLYQLPDGLRTEPYPELLEFVLTSNELLRPEKMRYRYRLLGLSDKWNYTTGENKVKFVHLSPGYYLFQVQAVSLEGHFGNWYTVPLFVATPYNETWWFKICIIGAIILVAFGAYKYRLRQIMKEQLIRQQVADDLHDDIGNKLNILGIIAQKVSAFLKKNNAPLPSDDSLEKLLNLSRESQISLITMIWAVDPSKDRLVNLIVRMQDFADDFVRPLVHQFAFTAPKVYPDRDLNLRVRHHLILIYQELLTNMVKHTQAEAISVELLLEGDKMVLTITNRHQANLNPPYLTTSGNRGQNTLNRRLKEINGTMEYQESVAGEQKIAVTVPKIFKGS